MSKRLSPQEYHEAPGVSSGMLRCYIHEGPWVYYHRYILRLDERDATPSQELGTAFHLAVTDPNNWQNYYRFLPTEIQDTNALAVVVSDWKGKSSKAPLKPGSAINLRYPAHRQYLDLVRASAPNAVWLESSIKDTIEQMLHSVWESPIASQIIAGATKDNIEVSKFIEHVPTGLMLKALADLHLEDASLNDDTAIPIIVDFKTTRHPTKDEFIRDAIAKGYHQQAAHYIDIFGADQFYFLTVRNAAPFEAQVYHCPQHRIDQGRDLNERALEGIKECHAFENWHSLGWGSDNELEYEGSAK